MIKQKKPKPNEQLVHILTDCQKSSADDNQLIQEFQKIYNNQEVRWSSN